MAIPQWTIGFMLAVISAGISNLGLNLEKRQHLNNAKKHADKKRKCWVSANAEDFDSDSSDPAIFVSKRGDIIFSSPNSVFTALGRRVGGRHSEPVAPPPTDDVENGTEALSLMADTCLSQAELQSYINEPYYRQKLWMVGITLVTLGSFLDFAALAFAPQSLIAPLGSLTLVANAIFAPWLLGEKLTKQEIISTVLIIIGSAVAVSFSSHHEENFSIRELYGLFYSLSFLVYALFICAYMLVLWLTLKKIDKIRSSSLNEYTHWLKWHRFCYASLAGVMGAQSVLFAKCISLLLKVTLEGSGMMFADWPTYFVLIGLFLTIFLQIKWQNAGLQLFTALYILPVFQSFWILGSVLGGLIFYGEWLNVFNNIRSGLGFPAGIIITVIGVAALSSREDGNWGVASKDPISGNVSRRPTRATATEDNAALTRVAEAAAIQLT